MLGGLESFVMNHFAIHYLYAADSEDIVRVRPEHRQFLGELRDKGQLVGSGPYTDGLGGALIIIRLPEPATISDAEELMDLDPFTQQHCLAGRTVREWNPVINVFS